MSAKAKITDASNEGLIVEKGLNPEKATVEQCQRAVETLFFGVNDLNHQYGTDVTIHDQRKSVSVSVFSRVSGGDEVPCGRYLGRLEAYADGKGHFSSINGCGQVWFNSLPELAKTLNTYAAAVDKQRGKFHPSKLEALTRIAQSGLGVE